MKRAALLLAFLALPGCDFRAKAAAERKHLAFESDLAELRERVFQLEEENKDLRARLLAVESKEHSPSPPSAVSFSGARCSETGGTYRLSKGVVSGPLVELSREARIVPAFTDGVAKGFKIFAVRADSFFASCGIRNGDVISSVNGFALNTPDAALEAYTRLRTATRLSIAIERQGLPETILIELDP